MRELWSQAFISGVAQYVNVVLYSYLTGRALGNIIYNYKKCVNISKSCLLHGIAVQLGSSTNEYGSANKVSFLTSTGIS